MVTCFTSSIPIYKLILILTDFKSIAIEKDESPIFFSRIAKKISSFRIEKSLAMSESIFRLFWNILDYTYLITALHIRLEVEILENEIYPNQSNNKCEVP